MTCEKCHTDAFAGGRWHEENEKNYYLCGYCSTAVEQFVKGKIQEYMDDENLDMVNNSVTRSIILARMRRAKKAKQK